MRARSVFITGTNTGAGKTILTALLLHHLRESGVDALALKPVCTGPRDDVRLLQSLQPGSVRMDLMNPFYYKTPATPAVAARRSGRKVEVKALKAAVSLAEKECDQLLVEGAGGVLVPLNERGQTWADFLKATKMPVLVAARNELGILNHTLLTVEYLQSIGAEVLGVCLQNPINGANMDSSQRTNFEVLRDYLSKLPVFSIPFLGENVGKTELIKQGQKKTKKTLAEILELV